MSELAALAEAKPNAKVQDILQAAQALFIAKGFEAASMDGVAKAAGVSKATVYAHFGSKNDLFAAIVGQMAGRLTSEIGTLMQAHLPLREALMRIGLKFLEVLTEPRRVRMFRMMVAEVDRFPDLGRVFYRAGPLTMQNCLAHFLADAVAEGTLSCADAGLAARQFLSLIKADLHLRCLLDSDAMPAPVEREQQVSSAVDFFLKGYGTDRTCS